MGFVLLGGLILIISFFPAVLGLATTIDALNAPSYSRAFRAVGWVALSAGLIIFGVRIIIGGLAI